MAKSTGSRVTLPGFKSKLQPLSAVWHWMNYLTFLSLIFLICKVGILVAPSWNYCEAELTEFM